MIDEYSFTSKIYDPLLYPALRGIRSAVTKALYPSRHNKILDLCCGTGNQMKIMENKGFSNLHCLDISPNMLKVARKTNPGFSIYERDATKTGFTSNSFDIVILSFAIHEKSRNIQEKMVSEAHRILRKNGTLLVVDYLFDAKSFVVAKWGVTAIERIAGKEHYNNFRSYIKKGGLNSLLTKEKWKLFKETRHIFKSITISQFKKSG
jgi:ubiquinone/menaquinone biosynthesis C-methylase UbiE